LQKLKIPEIGKISQAAATCSPIEKIDASCAIIYCIPNMTNISC
jgi:hypothetical protein